MITTNDGAQVFYKDWGAGQPVVLSHGWPLNSDSWESQMLFLADHGFRCIAHDRRGHGRSGQTWYGNDMDTYADDLSILIERLGLQAVTLIGFGAGGGEISRYIGRYGTGRVAKVVLVSTVTPYLPQDDTNPEGVWAGVFDGLRADAAADRSQLYQDLAATTYFGGNRPGSAVSAGMRDAFWLQGMTAGHRNALESIRALSGTDFRDDLPLFDIPALVIHGGDDQLTPLEISGQASAALIPGAVLKVYAGAPHGLAQTHQEQLSEDLLQFIVSGGPRTGGSAA